MNLDAIKEYMAPELIWFVVGFVLLMLEFALPGLIIFFFGVGAWIAALVCWVAHVSFNVQMAIFLVASVLSLVVLRNWLKGIFYGHIENTQELTEEMKEFVGECAQVVEAIGIKKHGKVEIHGTRWAAQADQDIAEGDTVTVLSKDNLTLTVKPI